MPDVDPKDFGPSKPADDLDEMFGPEPRPASKTASEAWRLWARHWNVDLKEEKKEPIGLCGECGRFHRASEYCGSFVKKAKEEGDKNAEVTDTA